MWKRPITFVACELVTSHSYIFKLGTIEFKIASEYKIYCI
jgi:hypothetical protein